nr:MAG TPA: protein of unknown function (UPF0242) [Bacteriophage sp.]
MENSIEEDITLIEKSLCDKDTIIQYHYWVGTDFLNAVERIVADYKRVLKENEIYKKNSEIMSKENLSTAEQLKVEIKENFRLKNQLENNRKEYQETYKDIREELGELKKENEELNNRCRNLDKEAQAYLEELAGDNTLTRRTIKQLQEENEECKLDVQDYLKQAQENAEMYRKAQKKIQDLKAENEELKNNTRKNENELEFDIDCDWIALQKMLDESEKSNEYISYKNEKWIKEKYCIPVQKIKDIIDRIDYDIKKTKEIISKNTNIFASYRKNDYQIVRLKAMNTKSLDIKKRLQELLESEK